MFGNALHCSFLLLAFFLQTNPSLATPANGYTTDLIIHQNDIWQQAYSNRHVTYTSVVEYDADTKDWLSDAQLAGLARQAYAEMVPIYAANRVTCGSNYPLIPPVMSALAIGNRVYFASSFKGNSNPNIFFKPADAMANNQPAISDITRTLNECGISQQGYPMPGMLRHNQNGNCGEIVAGGIYMAVNKQPLSAVAKPGGVRDNVVNARIAPWYGAVEMVNGNLVPKDGGIIGPCTGSVSSHGCIRFLESQGVNGLRAGSAFENSDRVPVRYLDDSLKDIWNYIGGIHVDELAGFSDDDMEF
ncbi:uncharacterized protein BDR25DRAFT_380817 [Lindgomyces ingoldianus]|uniref:Uncharacterized protein n=1 Tax=Lindgomyces ingoldianus TaxID=673940 RepID=A0ACB6QCB9_9PLEO|nr:uncharacterized protein BDR25DRAFT_380817 [Lindgomyces ingoldianus]KAF2464583.1 hypothetical protein BDR25DRAFT_380817 [Lindgomyces ingoldianus]